MKKLILFLALATSAWGQNFLTTSSGGLPFYSPFSLSQYNGYALTNINTASETNWTPVPLQIMRLASGTSLSTSDSPGPHYWNPNLQGAQNGTWGFRFPVQTRSETNLVVLFYVQASTTNKLEIDKASFQFSISGRNFASSVAGFLTTSNGVTGPFYVTNSYTDTSSWRAFEIAFSNPTNALDSTIIYVSGVQYHWQ